MLIMKLRVLGITKTANWWDIIIIDGSRYSVKTNSRTPYNNPVRRGGGK